MRENTQKADVWLWLTVPIAILGAIASATGLFVNRLYRDTPGLVAQAVGQDCLAAASANPAC